MNEVEDTADFHTLGEGLLNLKVIAGLAQMAFGVIMYVVNHYFFQEGFVEYGAYATFAFGFFLVGVKINTLISPSKKLIKITKGFFFFTFSQVYSASEISKIQVTKKSAYGRDSNGIGPTRENVRVTTYYVEIVLRNTTSKSISSGESLSDMNAFATKVGSAIQVPVVSL